MSHSPHTPSTGPLAGLRVIEFAGIGPCPFAGMMLADMGADVVVIDKASDSPVASRYPRFALNRGKRSVALDLKSEQGREVVWALLDSADALIEGFRPGVMERLGLGPEEVLERIPKLVYGRVTGWGQSGPLSQAAGHDINYVALSGAMSISKRPGQAPVLPPTLVGDLGGGAMFLCFGLVCALLEAQRSGKGQVVDAAMIDGVAAMTGLIHQMRSIGYWQENPQHNFFKNTSAFYEAFECADGEYVTFGAIEPQFYAELLKRLGLADVDPKRQFDVAQWPDLKQRVVALMRTRSRDEWCKLLEGTDACFAPVLSLTEAAAHPHNAERGLIASVEVDGKIQSQPAVAPRLSRTAGRAPAPGAKYAEHTQEILSELGYAMEQINAWRAEGVCA